MPSERFTYAESEIFPDGRIFSPTCLRNNPPMVARLALEFEGRTGPVLEIGAGTGQHAAAFALAFPYLTWVPSDPEPLHRRSIAAWQETLRAPRCAPLALDAALAWDALDEVQALGPLTAVLSMNVIHIAPIDVARGIITGAARALAENGLLIFYGPFHKGGTATGPGNNAFDRDLRSRNRDWGIRDLDEITALATAAGFAAPRVEIMPADNRLAIFHRPAAGSLD